MAPMAIEIQKSPELIIRKNASNYKEQAGGREAYIKKIEEEGDEEHGAAKYQNYLPTWNPEELFPPMQRFIHTEHGRDADATFPELLGQGVTKDDLTPIAGSIINGVQLSTLTNAGKDQLALLTAHRKVLLFRNQDFANLPIDKALEFGGYFGRHHIHPTSGAPKGYPEVHLVHKGAHDHTARQLLEQRTSTIAWHSDVTYEEQPPGTTFLYIFDKPTSGGDTIFADMVEAYNRLSPGFQQRLHGLRAVHSGMEQAENARAKGSIVRREPVISEHPIVRTHPATGEKALYVNPQFTRYIVGYKKEESDALLKFLYDHIALGADFHVRVKWEEKSVVVWDNRVTCHSAILDWVNGQRRHLARITPQAEAPYETPFEEPKKALNGQSSDGPVDEPTG